jgi:hypothetical protein
MERILQQRTSLDGNTLPVVVKKKVKVMLRLMVNQSLSFGVNFTLELVKRYYFMYESCCVVSMGRPL